MSLNTASESELAKLRDEFGQEWLEDMMDNSLKAEEDYKQYDVDLQVMQDFFEKWGKNMFDVDEYPEWSGLIALDIDSQMVRDLARMAIDKYNIDTGCRYEVIHIERATTGIGGGATYLTFQATNSLDCSTTDFQGKVHYQSTPIESPSKAILTQIKEYKPGMVINGCRLDYIPPPQNSSLKEYYDMLFPHADIFQWMSYGHVGRHSGHGPSFIGRREFSFTLQIDEKSKKHLRFQSFNTLLQMENAIKKYCPLKMNIGPVYNVEPSTRLEDPVPVGIFMPVERELIFDIDFSVNENVRYCCYNGPCACSMCWPLMAVAIKVIDSALRDVFRFEHILWVFSGQRGVHCWVCDGEARSLTNERRAEIADYFSPYKGIENSQKKGSLEGEELGHFLRESSKNLLRGCFEKLLHTQHLLVGYRLERILEMIPEKSITESLSKKWDQDSKDDVSGVNHRRWKDLKQALSVKGLRKYVDHIIFTCTCPRIDVEVSKHMNRLFKAPFSIHHKTGRVCVPIDPTQCDEFDPADVPTLFQLLDELKSGGIPMETEDGDMDPTRCEGLDPAAFSQTQSFEELDAGGKQMQTGDDLLDKTSLGKAIRRFRSFLLPLLKSCEV